MEVVLKLAFLVGSLLFIVAAAELFTNAIEWVGKRFDLSQGAVGSVLAAVGTAMPETIVPIVAILFARQASGEEIGVGAIVGAPFMLSTLAILVLGASYVVFKRLGVRKNAFDVDGRVIKTDMSFFLAAFPLAILAGLLSYYIGAAYGGGSQADGVMHIVKYALAIFFVVYYVIYARRVLSAESEGGHSPKNLYFHPYAHHPRLRLILLQVAVSLAMIIAGSRVFVFQIDWLARHFGMAPLVLSLLVVPIATELPEKMNSIIWVKGGKDTLAMGNISGAMVFQSTFPAGIGIVFTSWAFPLNSYVFASAVLTMASALIIYVNLRRTNEISHMSLMIGGVFYAIYIALVALRVF
jgi:cation:H+ antiporter